MPIHRHARVRGLGLALLLGLGAACAGAQQAGHQHRDGLAPPAGDGAPRPLFVASTAKPYAALMDDAMAVMDEGMRRAPMNGHSAHDFVTMMIPHHQGGIDMAKAVLLYSDDPRIRNLALGIIAEQQNEIHVMQAWLQQHPETTRLTTP